MPHGWPFDAEGGETERSVGVLHRSAVTAVDVLATPTAAGTPTDNTTDGALLASTTYKLTYAAYNRWGVTTCPTPASKATAADASNTHALISALTLVAGADGYDIFCSTDAAPKWVGRITEAQRLAGGCRITAVGTVTATGGGAAGTVQVDVAGTGVASTANPFAVNNAYTPASVTPVSCAGHDVAILLVKLAVTDLRSLPTLIITPFFQNSLSTGDWHRGASQTVTVLTAAGEPLEQSVRINVDGALAMVCLVQAVSGQGAAASIWVETA